MRKGIVRLICLNCALVMLTIITPSSGVALAETNEKIPGNVFKLTTVEDFTKGTINGLTVDESVGDGALRLVEGLTDGEYVSGVFEVEPFEYLVASWNSDTPKGTYIEVFARAYVDMYGEWSDWVSWGQWGKDIPRASTDDANDLVMIDTDVFTVRGSAGETAGRVQLKVALHADEVSVSPVLRQLAATYKNTFEGQEIEPSYLEVDTPLPEAVRLDTPAYSQLTRESSVADAMCSAVAICTLLNDRGEDLMPEEVALLIYDYYYEGFGNWSFSIGAAGAYGYEAYVQYADFAILRQELAKGYSVGISVKYSSSPDGRYPYLENGAESNTPGHLITITGYETVDGVDYFYSSDSGAVGDANCTRRYRADQLDAAWSNRVAYIVHDKEENAGYAATERLEAELKYVEGSEYEYNFVVDGVGMALPAAYLTEKLKTVGGGGIICFIIEDEEMEPVEAPAAITTANSKIKYNISVTENGAVRLELPEPAKLFNWTPDGGKRTLTVYFMGNDGATYVSKVELTHLKVGLTHIMK